jgi:hypothetical protein
MVGYRAGMGKVLVAHDNFQSGLICVSQRSLDVWIGSFWSILAYPPHVPVWG